MIDVEEYIVFLKEQLLPEENVLMEYEGPFGQSFIRETAIEINKLVNNFPQTQKRLFYIFVELAQNVGFYSEKKRIIEEKKIGEGSLLIFDNRDEIGFIIGNTINSKAFKVFERKCKIINSLDRESLRELKRFQRNLIPGTNSNAHIGLIMVSLTTRKQIELKSVKVDETNHFFSIKISVEKEGVEKK